MLLLLALALAPVQAGTHPRWMAGDWCYPTKGKPLHFSPDVEADGDETSRFTLSGHYSELGESGRWWIKGNQLILRRDQADSWALGKGERVRTTEVIRFVRHGRDAMSWRGSRNGWVVRC